MTEKREKSILIAEDDTFLLNLMKVKLSNEGYVVHTAEDGEKAFEILKTVKPDLIILDLVMPIKNGFEVLEDLNKNKKLNKIPVIIFTNLAQESDRKRVEELGVRDYLIKADTPIQSVVDKVKQVCGSPDGCSD